MKRCTALSCFALATLLIHGPRLSAQMGGAATGGDGGQTQTAFGAGRMVQGTVTIVSADTITLKTEAGDSYRVTVTPNTQVRKERAQVKLTDIHAGDGLGAMGEIDRPNKTVHALMVFVVDAEQVRKARENLGKTYIAGKLTAIDLDDLKLTVLRSDGVSQVIRVDEGTSFKRGGRGTTQALGFAPGAGAGGPRSGQARPPAQEAAGSGGESITLADIKVGDLVGGPGAIRGGTFIPTELSVATPGARRHRTDETPGTAPRPQEPK